MEGYSGKKAQHAAARGDESFPRKPRTFIGRTWAGWLTEREYDVLDMAINQSVSNIGFFVNKTRTLNSCQKMHSELSRLGLIEGTLDNFRPTLLGRRLFKMTDEYILNWDEEDRHDGATGT